MGGAGGLGVKATFGPALGLGGITVPLTCANTTPVSINARTRAVSSRVRSLIPMEDPLQYGRPFRELTYEKINVVCDLSTSCRPRGLEPSGQVVSVLGARFELSCQGCRCMSDFIDEREPRRYPNSIDVGEIVTR